MSPENTAHQAPQPLQYAEDVLCANWNPLAPLLVELLPRAQNRPVLDAVEAEALLARLYLCQQA